LSFWINISIGIIRDWWWVKEIKITTTIIKKFCEIIFIMNFSRENERRDLQLSTCVGPKLSAFFKK
jgi:hypothetical protein